MFLNTFIRRVYGLDKRGELPEELLDLPYLTFLKIDLNFFSGPLPAFIGNMSRLELLSVAHNVFSGSIPQELGNLKELYLLSFGNNNFSGTLPPELGNLVKLQQIYINSCGLGCQIPSTFANLENLETVWASDAAFTGKIPDFIGNNWTKLTTLLFIETSLRIEGNSFQGPIPSSFANLSSLNSLRIGGIYNGSSSLNFVRNLKNLTDLDLSFNNITGEIPSALFTMNSLKYLFLGNNSLSGAIPSQKSETLQTMNLVANNFTLNSTNIRLLPGLECLQRSFPCNRNAPRYFKPNVSGIPPGIPKEKNHVALIVGVTVPTVALAFILVFVIIYAKRQRDDDDEELLLGINPRPNTYSYSELKAATENFSSSNKLGEGGFGPVYKGTLSDGTVVAVKRLSVASNQGKEQFVTEIATISAVQHRNLVKLLGCCIGGKRRLLVYEYLENKSLDQALFDYSPMQCNYLEVAWTLHENNQLLSLVDPTLLEFNEDEALRVIGVAFLCTQGSPLMRPPMSRVVGMLAGDFEVNKVTTKPSYITDWAYKDISRSFMKEESQTSNASDHSSNDVKSKNKTTVGTDDQPIHSPVNITEFQEIIGEGR
ncbi:putative LRR receptor-like serine/threonine-protein kinase [Gossypium australe]|uniref:Putative LRR receptor-like serine/threonine-protein kinase n=1 Tax=Gossypium australe TaxID=47621 RepID=A0A5B6WBP2_9ROSI|nr:putative LRR receptor-like serine/threonine-protein kinase [Gossypium australe]